MKTFFVIIGALFACIIFNSCGSEDVFPEKMQMDGMSEFGKPPIKYPLSLYL